ncbi:MAG: DEAD/DEAH box helicase [Myxococcales bacterium]|nr:DEAD/DEAH box helicase [Myxococcales bacterium]
MSNDLVAPNGVADSEPAADLAAAAATDLAAPAATDAAPTTVPETAIVAAAPEIAAPDAPPEPSFDDMGLHPDIRTALDDMGYFRPTAVQATVFRPVAEGKDLLVQSRTGTGKTAAFGLPLLNRLVPAQATPQALILAPTRELALQVSRELAAIGKHRGIIIETLYGGAPIGKQIAALRQGVHVVVGTPGRVLDHIGRRTLDTKTISTFILDECDEMLSMGFLEDIERVVSHLPEKRQTLLFSATMPDEVHRYSRRHMRSPEQIKLSSGNISVEEIHHAYYVVSGIGRARDLLKLLFSEEPESAIIFCNMRDETTAVAKFLQRQGLDAEALSSDLSQSDRERVMGRMKAHNLRFLVATDVAARGIDISNLSHVINYSFPESPEVYVHRTGRTGRAGKRGVALSLVGPRDLGPFWLLKLTYKLKPEERDLPPETIFEGKLKHPLPPLGAPKPPDPLSILVRGVPGAVTDLERGIFDKMVANPNGRRVLARLMADKLSELTTKTRPKTERPARVESTEGVEAEAPRERSFRDDRPPREGGDRFRDRGDRFRGRDGEGPRGRDDGFRGRSRDDRPRDAAAGPVDGPREGGDRPPREGGDRFRDRGDRDRFRDDRPRDASAAPADAPREGGDRPPREGGDRFRDRGDRDRSRDDRPRDAAAAPADAPREGGDRPPREGGDRFRDRGDRDRNRDDRPRDAAAAPADAPREGGDRPPREGGDRFRDRGDRDRNRDDRPRDAAAAPADAPREGGDRPPREGGDRFRDRGDRDRNRDDRPRDGAAAPVDGPRGRRPSAARRW